MKFSLNKFLKCQQASPGELSSEITLGKLVKYQTWRAVCLKFAVHIKEPISTAAPASAVENEDESRQIFENNANDNSLASYFSWLLFRGENAQRRLCNNAGSVPTEIWPSNGCTTLHSRLTWRALLVGCHFIRIRYLRTLEYENYKKIINYFLIFFGTDRSK